MTGHLHSAHQRIALLDADPELAGALSGAELQEATRRAVASVLELDPPDWSPDDVRAAAGDGWLGLLVLDGLMIRRVLVGKRPACELFGPGDLIRPWDTDGEYDPLPISVDWLILTRSRLALLDTAFALRIAPWPTITSRLVGRVAQRARYLALTEAVTHLRRVHSRLLIYFWLLAERWGRVGPDGVHVSLPLTHDILAMLVGARRPTVTVGLQRLARSGLLLREHRDRWLLTQHAIDALARPESLTLIEEPA